MLVTTVLISTTGPRTFAAFGIPLDLSTRLASGIIVTSKTPSWSSVPRLSVCTYASMYCCAWLWEAEEVFIRLGAHNLMERSHASL